MTKCKNVLDFVTLVDILRMLVEVKRNIFSCAECNTELNGPQCTKCGLSMGQMMDHLNYQLEQQFPVFQNKSMSRYANRDYIELELARTMDDRVLQYSLFKGMGPSIGWVATGFRGVKF